MMFLRLEMHGIQNYLRKYGSFHSSGVWLNFKLTLGIIGIALIACNIPAFIDSLAPIFRMWRIPIIYFLLPDMFSDIAIVYGLFLLTMTVGLALYIIGRKEFSNRLKGSKVASRLLMFFGLILALTSLAYLGVAASFLLSALGGSWGSPLTSKDLAFCLQILVWCGLGFISSVLWLVDGAKMGEDKVLPLK